MRCQQATHNPSLGSNEPASHGFVKFTIDRRANLGIGDSITNRAAIYFDFNAPIITEPCIPILDVSSGISESATNAPKLQLFPNSSTGAVTLSLSQYEQLQSVNVLDVTGRVVHSGNSAVLDLSELPSGIYTVVANTNRGTVASKLVRQ
jgi:Secretion system C-terminal sorting domain